MKNSCWNNRAFTLMELMIVVSVIGIIAAFAIPNYDKAVERNYRKIAEGNLTLIYSANQVYKARYGKYWPGFPNPWQDLTAINTNLNLNIVADGFEYLCTSTDPLHFSCYAYRGTAPGKYWITIFEPDLSPTNPDCTNGTSTCP